MEHQRFPTNVRIIGVMHKDTAKMFMASVVWSDRNEVVVYRSFKDFKKLHKQLKKKHPTTNPFRKADRTLPRFRVVKKNFQKKGLNNSLLRVKALEKYCTELLQCDPNVTQSSEVVQFFHPKDHDLEPEFAKNSVMIVPSDDLSEVRQEGAADPHEKRLSMGNITQPFMIQTYRTVAQYETKDTKSRPFKVDVNETLDVLMKDPKGWWLVENEQKCLAWFPAPYLEPCEEEEDDFDVTSSEDMLYCAARNYVSKNRDEVSVSIGAVVEVLRKSDDGWWLIRYNGRVGYVPSMYLQPYNNPFLGLQKRLYSSTFNLSSVTPVSSRNGTPQPPSVSPRSAMSGCSRSLEDLLEPRHVRPNGVPNAGIAGVQGVEEEEEEEEEVEAPGSRKSSISTGSDETDFSFSSSGSDAEAPVLSGPSPRQAEVADGRPDTGGASRGGAVSSSRSASPRSGSPTAGTPALASTTTTTNAAAVVAPPRVPPRPQAQEIFARCTTYTRKAAMASRARLLPQHIQIPTR
ncbi:hypothetical protein ACEWY4_025831 [Coilia grayii]|uniref:NADPH oxidase organizer 1 n=1 Tax=Coilia grayii TaxID=363190 RepID=A0ABD1IT44_9TELE